MDWKSCTLESLEDLEKQCAAIDDVSILKNGSHHHVFFLSLVIVFVLKIIFFNRAMLKMEKVHPRNLKCVFKKGQEWKHVG